LTHIDIFIRILTSDWSPFSSRRWIKRRMLPFVLRLALSRTSIMMYQHQASQKRVQSLVMPDAWWDGRGYGGASGEMDGRRTNSRTCKATVGSNASNLHTSFLFHCRLFNLGYEWKRDQQPKSRRFRETKEREKREVGWDSQLVSFHERKFFHSEPRNWFSKLSLTNPILILATRSLTKVLHRLQVLPCRWLFRCLNFSCGFVQYRSQIPRKKESNSRKKRKKKEGAEKWRWFFDVKALENRHRLPLSNRSEGWKDRGAQEVASREIVRWMMMRWSGSLLLLFQMTD